EFSDGSGLELYETTFRGYDPQVGRFWQLDPLADLTESISLYVFANNNPLSFNDPYGLTAQGDSSKLSMTPENAIVLEELVVKSVRPKPELTQIDLGDRQLQVDSRISSESYKLILGWDPRDFINVLQQTVVDEPGFLEGLWKGKFYRGKNAFGDELYDRHYGGVAPSSGSFNRMAGVAKLFSVRTSRSWEELFEWGRNFDILKKLKTVSSLDVTRLKNAGVTLEELKTWSSVY